MQTIKGFTLIEMIVVMLITSIVVVFAATLMRTSFSGYFIAVNDTKLSTQATLTMSKISRELQNAISFSAINSTNVSFSTMDGSNVTYSWTNPTLTRTGSSAQILNNNITNFSLSYYRSDFTATSTLTLVKAITITMTVGNGNESVSLINTVFLNSM